MLLLHFLTVFLLQAAVKVQELCKGLKKKHRGLRNLCNAAHYSETYILRLNVHKVLIMAKIKPV